MEARKMKCDRTNNDCDGTNERIDQIGLWWLWLIYSWWKVSLPRKKLIGIS